MTGFSASWRKASPFAAPNAIFILMDQGRGSNTPATMEIDNRFLTVLGHNVQNQKEHFKHKIIDHICPVKLQI